MGLSPRFLALSSFLLLFPPSHGWTQAATSKPPPYVIHKIVFDGKTPYSQAALESAAGLKVDAPMTSEDLQAAAERLIETGAFGDVGASLDGPPKSVSVIFKLTPAEPVHMLQASFDNFVWFSHDELVAEVQKRVPLFNGFVPEGGSVQEAVEVALQQMLDTKGVKAKVGSQLVAPRAGQPFRMAEYHVQVPDVRTHSLEIAEVPATFRPATGAVERELIGKPYNDGLAGGFEDRILADYRNVGYQEAALTGVRTTIASATATRVEVDVVAILHTGEPYQVSNITWAGSPQMSAESFAAVAKLHPGGLASQQGLNDSLETLAAAYRNQGYVDVVLDAGAKLDTTAHQISYTVTATPGPQYKLRDLKVSGLTAVQRQEFDSAWKLHAGDIYNAAYVKSFLLNNPALPTLKTMAARFDVTQEPESSVLDLNITFRPNAGL